MSSEYSSDSHEDFVSFNLCLCVSTPSLMSEADDQKVNKTLGQGCHGLANHNPGSRLHLAQILLSLVAWRA